FGGRIQLLWPEQTTVPTWARDQTMDWLLTSHELGGATCGYPKGVFPSGGNMWVRSWLCAGHRFDESLGPDSAAVPGEDVRYAKELMEIASGGLYVPHATVMH